MKSAEWICTKCGTTNRKLIRPSMLTHSDRCITCKQQHTIVPGKRPIRWEATRLK